MTEAYLNGFMKEAAAAGIDPDALVKAALNFGAIANGAGRLVGRTLGRDGVARVSGALGNLRELAGGAVERARPAVSGALGNLRELAGGAVERARPVASRYLELLGGGSKRLEALAGRATRESAARSALRQALVGRNANLGEQIGNLDRVISGYGKGIADASDQLSRIPGIAGRAADNAARAHEQYQFLLSRGAQLGTQAEGLRGRGLIQKIMNMLPGSQMRSLKQQQGIADAAAERAKGLFDANTRRVESLNDAAQRATSRRARLQELFSKANANRERLAAEQMRVQADLPGAMDRANSAAQRASRLADMQKAEGRKVLAARGGTAAAGGLGTAALLSGDDE